MKGSSPRPMNWLEPADPRLVEAYSRASLPFTDSDPLVVVNASGILVAATEDVPELLGIPAGALAAMPSFLDWEGAISPTGVVVPAAQLPVNQALASGEPCLDVLLGVTRPPSLRDLEALAHPTDPRADLEDAQLVWIHISAVPLLDPAGTSVAAVVLFEDVSSAEMGLAATAGLLAAYRMIADSSSDLVVAIGLDGLITWISPSVAPLLGYHPSQLVGTPPHSWLNPDDLLTAQKASGQVMAGAREVATRVRVRTAAGPWLWMSSSSSPALDALGTVIGRVSIMHDIGAQVAAEQRLVDMAARAKALYEGHSTPMLVFDADSGLVVDSNAAARAFYGYEDIVGMPVSALGEFPTAHVASATPLVDSSSPLFTHHRADGSARSVELAVNLVEASGQRLVFALVTDVTARLALSATARHAQVVFDNAAEGIAVLDVAGCLERANTAFAELTGWLPEELAGLPLVTVLSLDYTDLSPAAALLLASVRSGASFRDELAFTRPDGLPAQVMVSLSPVPDASGSVSGFAVVLTDMGALHAARERLEQLAHYDQLTGLVNRAYLAEHLAELLVRAPWLSDGTVSAVLLIGLDRFTQVNDAHGQAAGDHLLRTVADQLSTWVQRYPGAVLARARGDEFAVLLPSLSTAAAASDAATEILASLAAVPLPGLSMEVFPSACVGVSVLPGSSQSAELVLSSADAAFHEAKRVGPGTVRVHSTALNSKVRTSLSMDARLRRAFATDQLSLVYQPQVDVATGAVVAAEALMRWHPPSGVAVPPSKFIPVAEETGLILAFDQWVVAQACEQLRSWDSQGLALSHLAVNVSARSLASADFGSRVLAHLSDQGLDPSRLELEVTESSVFAAHVSPGGLLTELADAGVRLAVDDFGTGYSSFQYLRDFPFSMLKIDRSFTQCVTNSPDDLPILSAMILLGHHLDMRVLAEGVETPCELAYLHDQGVDLFQGFLASPGVPPQQFFTLAAASPFTFEACTPPAPE